MADWSTGGPLSSLLGGLDWSTPGPEIPEVDQGSEWFPVPGRLGHDHLVGIDRALVDPSLSVRDRAGIIERAGMEIPTALSAREILALKDRVGSMSVPMAQREILGAMDRAALGIPTHEHIVAIDRASIPNIFVPGRERLGIKDRASESIYIPQRDFVGAVDRGTGAFAYAVPVTVEVTATGTVTIPPWFRYIDVVGVSPGGGGASGNQVLADGVAGTPGNWLGVTWDRGVSRNGWLTINVTIGAPGVGAPRNVAQPGTNGGDIKIEILAANLSVSATGGLGGSGLNGVGQTRYLGPGPGNQIWQGVTYVGGGQAAKSEAGKFPGGAGAGGSGSGWPGNGQPGGNGGAAKVWIRFWMD